VILRKSTTGLTNPAFRIHFFKSSPAVGAGDNSAPAPTLKALWLASIDVTATLATGDGAVGNAVATHPGLFVQPASTTLYGLLTATAAYAPGSAETFSIDILLRPI
jgi:hypothetical protein